LREIIGREGNERATISVGIVDAVEGWVYLYGGDRAGRIKKGFGLGNAKGGWLSANRQ